MIFFPTPCARYSLLYSRSPIPMAQTPK
uniref:Uncharacterized protein n=1 Tax=Arundo donax TaxID=35708 RepID=A0A0A8YER1_ARUDO